MLTFHDQYEPVEPSKIVDLSKRALPKVPGHRPVSGDAFARTMHTEKQKNAVEKCDRGKKKKKLDLNEDVITSRCNYRAVPGDSDYSMIVSCPSENATKIPLA